MPGPLRSIFLELGISFDPKPLNAANMMMKKATGLLSNLAGVAASSLSVLSIKKFAIDTMKAANDVGAAAEKIGLSYENYQKLEFVAERLDVSFNKVARGIQMSTARIGEAVELGTGQASDAIKALGLNLTDLSRQTNGERYETLRSALSNVENESIRAGLAQKIFGRAAKATMTMLRISDEEFRQLTNRFHELGGGFSDKFIKNSMEFNDQLDDMRLLMRGAGGAIVSAFMPQIKAITKWIVDDAAPAVVRFTKDVHKMGRVISAMKGILILAGGVLLIFAGTSILAGLAVGGLILILEDLWTNLQGGESLFGRVADAIGDFMHDIATDWFAGLGSMWRGLEEFLLKIPIIGKSLAKIAGDNAISFEQEAADRGYSDDENAGLLNPGRLSGAPPGGGVTADQAQPGFWERIKNVFQNDIDAAAFGGLGQAIQANLNDTTGNPNAGGILGAGAGGVGGGGPTEVTITVDGAKSPMTTARTIQRVLKDAGAAAQ